MGNVITGTGRFVPDRRITNEDLSRVMDTNPEWIERRSGVKTRYIAAPGVGPSDLAAAAGAAAVDDAGLTVDDVDVLITATMTPDSFAPGIAPLVQTKMGLGPVAAHDIRQQCSGFLYGLDLADALLSSGKATTALVVGAEVHAGYQPWIESVPFLLGQSDTPPTAEQYERNTQYRAWSVLFGDGAGAAILQRDANPTAGIIASRLFTDGTHFDLIHVPAPGFTRQPYLSLDVIDADLHMPTMKGRELFRQAVTLMPQAVEAVLADAGLAVADLDVVVAHQANARIVDAARKQLGVDAEVVPINIDRYGNTTAGTLPILFDELRRDGKIQPGALVAFTAFGAGAHWGAVLYREPEAR
ncbi:MAG: 3-oxoacyl-[acyl-carrier-protein] synthase III C-terminal domain-containing protein [Acidimicrobiia bacterium]|nr:3-oxoacyl-[acyl-carrier-protein] synthase III C-terminal domain-containing protein [Acidimicrobiia bacterium]